MVFYLVLVFKGLGHESRVHVKKVAFGFLIIRIP